MSVVSVIHHAMYMRHIAICGLTECTAFSTLYHKRHYLRGGAFVPLLLLLPLALQPTVCFGLSNNILPFFPICHQHSPSSQSQHLPISFYFLFPSFPWSWRGGGVTEHKMCALIFSTTFVRTVSCSKKNSARYDQTVHAVCRSSCEVPLLLLDINDT